MAAKFYLTTTLPYVNADPHLGFAAEIVRADAIARWRRLKGDEVFFNTGTDEHGLKIYRQAAAAGQDPQAYVDAYAAKFDDLKKALDLSYNSFTRTTDARHQAAAQAFWRRCAANGDIYKKTYQVKYCVGCELEKTDSELVNGFCPLHPAKPLETINEENYFFRWSAYADKLLSFYDAHPDFIIPGHRLNEIRNFIKQGLKDFSISRLKKKMPWGVPVPDDQEQVMYVWFDALVNYISCLGWPDDQEQFRRFWPGWQVAGKDNLRQQAAMWQAMLMSAGLPNSEQLLIFGFITANGQKMSKSLGNTVDPFSLTAKYGTDAVRYYLLADLPAYEDADYTEEKFAARYMADLANGLGNLAARVAALLEKDKAVLPLAARPDSELSAGVDKALAKFQFDAALKAIWQKIAETDEYLSAQAPWKMPDPEQKKAVLAQSAQNILDIGFALRPFLPASADKIIAQYGAGEIRKGEPLFPRLP